MRGNQYSTPHGYETLRAGVEYHRIRTDSVVGRVLLASFSKQGDACLHVLSQLAFEKGLSKAKIILDPQPSTVPCWLRGSFASMDAIRAAIEKDRERLDKKRTDEELASSPMETGTRRAHSMSVCVSSRHAHIMDAVHNVRGVLDAANPCSALNRYAKAARQNERRFRNWFFGFIVYGHKQEALAPRNSDRGRYDRGDAKYEDSRFGRDDLDGNKAAYRVTAEVAKKIVEGFDTHAKVGMTKSAVYRAVIEDPALFGCSTQKDGKLWRFFHPAGDPFPSERQFWYHVGKAKTAAAIYIALRGQETHRNRIAQSEGSYSSLTVNVGERVHCDVEFAEEVVYRYGTNGETQTLAICQIYDSLGIGLGISAGHTEDDQVYLDALFSMAIPKSLLGELIGLILSDQEWPCRGLPSLFIADRGPASRKKMATRLRGAVLARQSTPSYSPQSNSPVESRHSRSPSMTGAPTHVDRGRTPIQVLRSKTEQMVRENTISTSGPRHASNDQIMAGEYTSLALYVDLKGRGRSDEIEIDEADAVRLFLMPVKFKVGDGFFEYEHQQFGGAAYRKHPAFAKMHSRQGEYVNGWVYRASTRYVWVELEGVPVRIEALLPYQDDKEQLYLSLSELEEVGRCRGRAVRKLQKATSAASSASEAKLRAAGDVPRGGRRQGRKPRRHVRSVKGKTK
jgi:hypothetical protein